MMTRGCTVAGQGIPTRSWETLQSELQVRAETQLSLCCGFGVFFKVLPLHMFSTAGAVWCLSVLGRSLPPW